jgi:hypothetical protein
MNDMHRARRADQRKDSLPVADVDVVVTIILYGFFEFLASPIGVAFRAEEGLALIVVEAVNDVIVSPQAIHHLRPDQTG